MTKLHCKKKPNFKYGPIKRLKFKVEIALYNKYAQDLSRQLSNNIKRGMRSSNRCGRLCNMAPQGYLNVRDSHNQPVVKPDPKRFTVIKEIFELFLTGVYNITQLTNILNNNFHYKSKKHCISGGRPLSAQTVSRMLSNPFYMGKIRSMDDPNVLYDGKWKPMITEEQFYKIQEIKATQRTRTSSAQ